jgi:hypothetical protein
METVNLNHFKSVAVHRFFIEPADNDYLLTRWMLANNFPELFWHCSQAFEKYLKAGLLLNGLNVSKTSHKIKKLYDEHVKIFGNLALKKFTIPTRLHPDFWNDESVDNFIDRIELFGNPDSRYGLVSWSRRQDDLFKIDQLCWSFRRLSIGLDWEVERDFSCDPSVNFFCGHSFRYALTNDAMATPRGEIDGLERNILSLGPKLGDILHSWNYQFVRSEDDISKSAPMSIVPTFGPYVNSILSNYWEVLIATDQVGDLKKLDPIFADGMHWLIENIKFQKGVKEEISKKLTASRES